MSELEKAFNQDVLHEKCAVVGVIGENRDASYDAYEALFALQHRGTDSTGIAVSDGEAIADHRAKGKVEVVYSKTDLEDLPGSVAIGHNRYGTSKTTRDNPHMQPVHWPYEIVASAHNGNIADTQALREHLESAGIAHDRLNDSEMMHEAVMTYVRKGATLPEAMAESYPLFTGAFSYIAMNNEGIVAARDQHGIRPFSIGQLDDHGVLLVSETTAIDRLGATYLGDVAPGTMLQLDRQGNRTETRLAFGQLTPDLFEYIYFAAPDSVLNGVSVAQARLNMGRYLAQEHPVPADIVVPVKNSGEFAALGFAQETGIDYLPALQPNQYVGRTFIDRDQKSRLEGVRRKHNAMEALVKGKRVVLVDDSIVRGTTTPHVVQAIRKAGATEVHLRISSPEVRHPNFYGIDTPDYDELIAANKSHNEIVELLAVNSLGHLSLDATIAATGRTYDTAEHSAFTGNYIIPIYSGHRQLQAV